MVKTSYILLMLALATPPLFADTAAEPIWRWVDEDGRVTYSNIKPPAPARDLTVIESRWAADETRRPSAPVPQDATRPGHQPWRDTYDSLLDALDALRGTVDDLRGELSRPRYVLYTPEADYAYSRRYDRGRRHNAFDRRGRDKRQASPFGARRYDRSYFSDAYRYRSDLPTFGADQTPRAPARRSADRDQRAYSRSQAQPGRALGYGRRP